MGRLDDKVAIVTGGCGGIGQAVARIFISEGARVWITDVQDGLDIARELGPSAAYIHHDVTLASDWLTVVKAAEARFGTVTTLVNNAGISSLSDESGEIVSLLSVEETSEAQFRRTIEVNQLSVFLGTRAVLPSLKRNGGGTIVNISSIAGLKGIPTNAAYVASKFAVTGLTRSTAIDLGKYGIRVNAVHPGLIETPMTAIGMASGNPIEAFIAALPLGRAGQPSEIGELVAFLASDASSYCTGGSFVADAGWSA